MVVLQSGETVGTVPPLGSGRFAGSASRWSAIAESMRPWLSGPKTKAERQGTERSLANARVFLAIAALAAVYVDPSEPSRFPELAYQLIWFYVAFSIGVRAVVALRPTPFWSVLVVHAVDVMFPCVLIVFAEGPSSPFFVLLPFALLAAAHRWGHRATLVTGAVGVVVLLLDGLVVWMNAGPHALHIVPLDPTQLMLRVAYLVVLALLIGYLAERGHRAQAEAAFIASMFGVVRARPGVTEMIGQLAERITRLFSVRRSLLAVHDQLTGRGALWEYDPTAPDGARLNSSKLAPADRALYFTPETRECWQETRGPVNPFFERHPCETLLACNARLGESIEARLYLLDPAGAPVSADKLQFFHAVVGQVGPAVYNGYLLHRLRSRVASAERRRLAGELHDGLVQSLLGLELTVEACRRRDGSPAVTGECLATVGDGLREAIGEARALVADLRRHTVTPQNLAATIRSLANRLQRETGIRVKVRGLDEPIDCTRNGAHQLAQIVHEALTNTRKHAAARNVTVVHTRERDVSRLVVTDDGNGFPFSGRLGGVELEQSDWAPAMLLERARSFGGRIAIESTRGAGATVIVEWPRTRHD